VLRNVASGLGLSAQQVSQNWSDVNYSSARAALLEAWKTMDRRRAASSQALATRHGFAFLRKPTTPTRRRCRAAGAIDFPLARHAYGRARWIGPGRGWVDPVAEREGAWLGMEMGTDTLENVAAEQRRGF
jgi:capsid protein